MTNDIKDIVERLSVMERGFNRNDKLGAGVLMKDAIAALYTLSEDNAAMKLEIGEQRSYTDRLEKLIGEKASMSGAVRVTLLRDIVQKQQALKNNPNA